jgi:hypothetical protein
MRTAPISGAVLVSVVAGVVPVGGSLEAQSKLTYRVRTSVLEHDLVKTPLAVQLSGADQAAGASVRLLPDGNPMAGQVSPADGGIVVHWIADGLKKGSKAEWRIELAEAKTDVVPRVDVIEEPGRWAEVRTGGGEVVTQYVVGAAPGEAFYKPYFYPVRGPEGVSVTRHFPMRKGVPGEKEDHPHQRSFWFTHGEVNGVDFWAEGAKTGRIVHLGFDRLTGGAVFAHLASKNAWRTPDGAAVLEERRDVKIYPFDDGESLWDFDVELVATEGPVEFGSTKEGSFGIRLAPTMEERAGGAVVSARGAKNTREAWGRPAEWIDYHGTVEGKTVGVAIFDHPASFRHPTHWHVRDYGLFAANPFGHRDYYKEESERAKGPFRLAKGESIRFRFRVYFHRGGAEAARVAEVYLGFATPPALEVSGL